MRSQLLRPILSSKFYHQHQHHYHYNYDYYHHHHSPRYLASALIALSVMFPASWAFCQANDKYPVEEEEEDSRRPLDADFSTLLDKKRLRASRKTVVDLYKNLPEEDPSTTSPLCQTFRQGPCRDDWRKLEFCVRDMYTATRGRRNRDTGECDSYIATFRKCWKEDEHTHLLYKLIELDVFQQQVRDMELDYRYDDKGSMDPRMDWTAWLHFLKEEGSLERAEKDCSEWTSLDKFVPLWKRFVILEKKPFLVNICTTVPPQHGDKSLVAVYALDQDSLVAGYSDDGSGRLPVTIVPGMTKTLTIKALYKENSIAHTVDKKKEYELEAILCVSPEMSLASVAQTVVPLQEPSHDDED